MSYDRKETEKTLPFLSHPICVVCVRLRPRRKRLKSPPVGLQPVARLRGRCHGCRAD